MRILVLAAVVFLAGCAGNDPDDNAGTTVGPATGPCKEHLGDDPGQVLLRVIFDPSTTPEGFHPDWDSLAGVAITSPHDQNSMSHEAVVFPADQCLRYELGWGGAYDVSANVHSDTGGQCAWGASIHVEAMPDLVEDEVVLGWNGCV